jgi:serine protease Do
MKRRVIAPVLFVLVCFSAFGQGALRDYVGLINQVYHPGIIAYFEKIKTELGSRGKTASAKAITAFLDGSSGSGFIIGASGNRYVLTNYHVVAQAYSLSITFENQEGVKKRYDKLQIIAADEEKDLALLAFTAEKPPAGGLVFLTRPVAEGEDVYSAGFPGLGTTPIWQFGRGMVSNAVTRFPKSVTDETLLGPFIQHTAQVDPGNSGGPLLVPQRSAPSGYAVAGINTLRALWRQAANYAIPVKTAQEFISAALSPGKEKRLNTLEEQLTEFTGGLGGNRAVYPHIAGYLSAVCVGEYAENALTDLFEKAPPSVQEAFINKCGDSLTGAVGYAVAWKIETTMRGQGIIRAAVKEVSGGEEEYAVTLTINGKDFNSIWTREYGGWKIKSFAAVPEDKPPPKTRKKTGANPQNSGRR